MSKAVLPKITLRLSAKLAHDVIVAMLVMQFTLWFRFSFTDDRSGFFYLWEATLVYGAVSFVVFTSMGLPRNMWRYTSIDELMKILKAVTLATVIFLPVLFMMTRLADFPRLVPLMQWPLLIGMLSASRIVYRLLATRDFKLPDGSSERIPVLLLGPSSQTEPFIREAQRLGADRFPYRILGVIGSQEKDVGYDIRGKRVLGTTDALTDIINNFREGSLSPQKLLLLDPNMPGDEVSALLEQCDKLDLSLARAPKVTDLKEGDPSKPVDVRPVDLRDLLGRPQKKLDRSAMRRLVEGKRVLVTGAGGTIGSELTRQIAKLNPSKLSVLDNSEFNLYQIDLELQESFPNLSRRQLLVDVRDTALVNTVFASVQPEVVFHAAALKHVPIVEDNPTEGALTNVGGTRNIVDACLNYHAHAMVMISTDKAVNPSNVMGASKRIAELYCQAQNSAQSETKFVTVRFGNVLGSTGSVVPLFQRQLARGGPLTVTDPDVTRYFMTTHEAVELVLQAAALDENSETSTQDGHIFVLDMGNPVLIKDLAARIIKLAGLRPYEDIDIVFTGLRPGEKLHESLFHEQEKLIPTQAEGILLARPRFFHLKELIPALDSLLIAAREPNLADLYQIIKNLVPEFEGKVPDPDERTVSSEDALPKSGPHTLH